MVRLLKACCQGGNDEVAMLVTSASAMVGVEECCRALLAHCRVRGSGIYTGADDVVCTSPLSSPATPTATTMGHMMYETGDNILRILAPPVRLAGMEDAEVPHNEMDEDSDFQEKPIVATAAAKKSTTPRAKARAGGNRMSFSLPSSAIFEKGVRSYGGGATENGEGNKPRAVVHFGTLGSAALTASESYEDGGRTQGSAFELLAFLVELVDLLPLGAAQVRSPLLWLTVKIICTPAIASLAHQRDLSTHEHGHHTSADRLICAELVDLLSCLLAKVQHHNSIDDLLADQYRDGTPMVDDMRDDLKFMAVLHPHTLGAVFSCRTREAVERIFKICDGQAVPFSKYTRKDPHVHHVNSNTDKGSSRHRVNSSEDTSRSIVRSASKSFLKSGSGGDGGGGLANDSNGSNRAALTLAQAFEEFQQGLTTNPHVLTAILRRRFQLLSVLENGTHPKPGAFPNGSEVKITWDMLVPRFVRYSHEPGRFEKEDKESATADHNGRETVHIILRLLRDHLVKARTLPLDKDGNVVVSKGTAKEAGGRGTTEVRQYEDTRMVQLVTIDVSKLPHKADRIDFAHKQHTLMKHGCVNLAARIMMAADSAVEDGDLADEALAVSKSTCQCSKHQ